MIEKKIHFTIDKTIKNKVFKKKILSINKNFSPHQANVIVVVGGDGFMLETLKNTKNIKNLFME